MRAVRLTGLAGVLLGLGCARAAHGEAAGPEFFEKKIRPVLVEQCYGCHSATSPKVRGGLRVDSRAGLLAGGDTGPALVPGKPEQSLLYTALTHADPDLAMPSKKPKLPGPVIQDFGAWIHDGAIWPAEATPATPAKPSQFDLQARKQRWPWIWQTPQRQPLPGIRHTAWPLVRPDYFILSRLEQKGLAPAPPADARTWLRRVSFALTGLPPRLDEIQDFLADTSASGRAKVVDRLLASPHYGERWARHWMDLVRYAESRGHESDYIIANAYHYRDYLIDAFNADVPYNQFVLEQVAGDLLPHPRVDPQTGDNESVLGTGWAFLGEEVHSPVDIRQDECDRVDNKVDVFAKTFLGLTVGCARCHDHKFDAITSKDYYALCGFIYSSSFRQVRFESMEHNRPLARQLDALRARARPKLTAALAAACRPGLEQMTACLMAAREVLSGPATEPRAARLETVAKAHGMAAGRLALWLEALDHAAKDANDPLYPFARIAADSDAESTAHLAQWMRGLQGARPSLPQDARVVADYSSPAQQPWKVDGYAFGSRPLMPGELCFSGDPATPIEAVMAYGAARRDPFWDKLKLAPGTETDAGTLAATARSGQMLCTPTFTLGCGKLHYLIRGKTRAYAAVDSHLMIAGPLHGELVRAFDGGAGSPRWVTHDLSAYVGQRVHVEFGPEGDANLEVLMVVESKGEPGWLPGTSPPRPETAMTNPRALAVWLQSEMLSACERLGKDSIAGAADAAQQAVLANWLIHHQNLLANCGACDLGPAGQQFSREMAALGKRVQWESHTAVSLFDDTGVDENILIRGKAVHPGALAPRSLPAAFGCPPIHATSSSGRYQLGQEMIDPANPLVARVIVNRVWEHLFGRGIVATVDNFGYLGERPTHPELLDDLAWRFVHEEGWSLKRLIRELVLSSTFAMGSEKTDAGAEEADPANFLLHRMRVRRLEAEVIRDALLAVSGRLDETVGGPPVPVYLDDFVIGRGRPERSGPLDGAGRRSIYTAVRRNFLPTLMVAFDYPTPFSTVGRRNVTNVPAQGLALMNDPLVHQEAGIWAARLLKATPSATPEQRIRWLFQTGYGRLPSVIEVAACNEALGELQKVEGQREDAPEVWSELCHALFNANDFIYVK